MVYFSQCCLSNVLSNQAKIYLFRATCTLIKESAVSDHLLQRDVPITFDDFDILASDSNKYKLFIKKSLLIKRDNPVLNRTTKSFPLDLFDEVFNVYFL